MERKLKNSFIPTATKFLCFEIPVNNKYFSININIDLILVQRLCANKIVSQKIDGHTKTNSWSRNINNMMMTNKDNNNVIIFLQVNLCQKKTSPKNISRKTPEKL